MFWVLKRTVSMRPNTYVKVGRLENIYNFKAKKIKIFVYLNLCVMVLYSPDWTNIGVSFILLTVNPFRHPTLIEHGFVCLFI